MVLSGGSALAQGEDGRLAEMYLRDKQVYSAGGHDIDGLQLSLHLGSFHGPRAFGASAARSHFQVSAPE